MKNLVRNGTTFDVSGPVASGDPVVVGQLSGVMSVSAATGETAVAEKTGVYSLSVEASGADLAAGGAVYHHAAADPVLNNIEAGGVLFGYLDATASTIADGATETTEVMLKG